MSGVTQAGSNPYANYSNNVCSAPPPEEQVCVAEPPPEEQVCVDEGNSSSSHGVNLSTPAAHTSDPHGVSFPAHGNGHGGGHGGHSTAETLVHGGHVAHTTGQVVDVAEGVMHARHVHNAASTGAGVASKVLAPVGVFMGGFEIAHGVDEIAHGNTADGILDVAGGTAGVVGGGSVMLGGAAATTVAPVAAAAGIGLAVGRAGDGYAAELNVFGNGNSVSDQLADDGIAVHDAVADLTGSDTLGHVAGVGTMIVELPAAGVVAVGSFVVGGVGDIWSWATD